MILAVSNHKNPASLSDGYRGRFAPSPTGPLHAGSLLAALGSWLDARKKGGKWLVRMEDLDSQRCIPGADQEILRQLRACGLQWDGEPSWQSAHHESYQRALERLNTLPSLYPCFCSRQTIADAVAAQGIDLLRHQETIYPGTCRPTPIAINDLASASTQSAAWRLALPAATEDHWVEFHDVRLGSQSQNLCKQVGDFVLRRNDGQFTYQLAVVVDDAEQAITHVVRGEDLLSNTARQIYLQSLLGYPRPHYLHLPLVLDEYGEKLSKQTFATPICTQDSRRALLELRKAATHLGLRDLPDGKGVSVAEWLLAATHAWGHEKK